MDYEEIVTTSSRERELGMSAAFPVLMRKVYLWMTLALVITAITAYGVATSPAAIQFILGNRIVFFGLIIAEFALVFAVGGMINRLSITTATLLFTLYSVVNGATLSVVLLAYTQESVTQVFFITAGTFAAMSAVGYLTKRDLSSVGRILFMALIGLIIATVVNIFWKNSGFMAILNYLGVLIFVGLTAYDTQKIKNMLLTAEDGGEVGQKMALLGALTLYLDFINLFLYLLRILGKARD
jgi:FtsH-binding integral membrane protein